MQHRLGNLSLRPDPTGILRELASRRSRDTTALMALIREMQRTMREAALAPDLLAVLRDAQGPDAWVFELASALPEQRELRLTHCEYEPGQSGFVALAVVDRSRAAEVREGDLLCGGLVATRAPGGEVEVLPRIYRKVCSNGAVMLTRTGGDVLRQTGDIREAVRACLAPETTDAAFALLDSAAHTPVRDPIEFLVRARLPIAAHDVWAAREEDDDTVFGVVNALTAHARREPSLARRLELERGAERILALVRHQAPSRRAARADLRAAAEVVTG